MMITREKTRSLTTALSAGLLVLWLAACSGESRQAASSEQAPAAPAAGAAPATQPSSPGQRASFDGLSFEVPSAWQARPPASRMRVAEYVLPAAEGDPEPGECALFHFPGQGGTVEANLQRWYGQFTQPDGSSSAEAAEVENFEANGLAVTLVRLSGTYNAGAMSAAASGPQAGYAMAAGVVETSSGPWFLKCVGPEATVSAATPQVRAVLQSSREG